MVTDKLFDAQDVPKLKAEITRLAAKYPDFMYKPPPYDEGKLFTCSNLEGGDARYPECKGCIVGQAVRNLGFTIDPAHDSVPAISLLEFLGLDVQASVEDLSWLLRVQAAQDKGSAWGVAVVEIEQD